MIRELIRALKAGEELKNAATWKNIQATANSVTSVFGALLVILKLVGVDLHVTTEEITYIAGGVAGVLGVFNTYTTVATSKKIGLPVSPKTESFSNPESDNLMG